MSADPHAEDSVGEEREVEEQQLERLLASEDDSRFARGERVPEEIDLEAAALEALEDLREDLQRPSDDRPELAEDSVEAPARSAVDRYLRILLAFNVALIGVVFLIPSGAEPATPAGQSAEQSAEPEPDRFVQEPRKIGDVPRDTLWENAVRAAGEGEYARAILLLERYVEQARLTDVERRLVYNQLVYYLVKDGRLEEARQYERMSHQITTRSYLPEDLLQSAHRAGEQGQLPEMRAAYARFLLQRKQVPPTLRKHIAEAYLKLGESYRLEAERAQVRAEQEEFQRMRQAGEARK